MNRRLSCTTVFLLFVLLSPVFISAQEKMKFGKIDPADLAMTGCPFDSAADAMVLGDVGVSSFSYVDNQGFELMFERLIRIKIFTKKGYEHANFEIPYYRTEMDKEQVIALKGRTYNLENGKVVETNLDDNSIFDEEVDAYWKHRKIAFPAVREGSVVELKYTIKSTFLSNLRDWYFQSDIPVRWSEYTVGIPEYFIYSKMKLGFSNFAINEEKTEPRRISQVFLERGGDQYNVTHTTTQSTVEYTDHIIHLASRNMPAFEEEPYTNSIRNYVSRIEFDYQGYKMPDGPLHMFNSTWEEVVNTLLKDEDFGLQLNRGGLVKDAATRIKAATTDTLERMRLAHDHIRNSIKWNDRNSKYCTTNLKGALDKKAGNSADVNLALVLLLCEAGIDAEPVILSTRSNGLALKSRVSIGRMNYVLAVARVGGRQYLLDATSRNRPWQMIPFQCLNGEGLVVSKNNVRWVPLVCTDKDINLTYAEIKIAANGELSGRLDVSHTGYTAVNERKTLLTNGEDKYRNALLEKLKEWTVQSVTMKNQENVSEPFGIQYQLASADIAEVNDNMIYLNVLLDMGQSRNPFRQQNRSYPVDFGYPLKDGYVFVFELPEGYMAESLPAPANVALPDNAGTFRFSATAAGSKVSVTSTLVLNKTHFEQPDYENLKVFFNQVAASHAQQIVLKKL